MNFAENFGSTRNTVAALQEKEPLKYSLSLFSITALSVSLLAALPAEAQVPEKPVRLVLQITVDQLRSDLIDRYSAGYG